MAVYEEAGIHLLMPTMMTPTRGQWFIFAAIPANLLENCKDFSYLW